MKDISSSNPHDFYIPVMGTSFTIDTPVKVARYGISSVVSLSDDVLIENMRRHYCQVAGEEYQEIDSKEDDSRSRRITSYLNLVNRIVNSQVDELVKSPFTPESEITRYFELLPDGSFRKEAYRDMLAEQDPLLREQKEEALRQRVVPGDIDVNIMTKVDPQLFRHGEKVPAEMGIAQSALRGFANSDLNSSVIFSAGLNPGLYTYTSKFNDFAPDENGNFRKRIVLKVSDFRSAMTQGKFLAKKGLWISEFRVESGINCGGHAFVQSTSLLGPVLDEFQKRREELIETLSEFYHKALAKSGRDYGGSGLDYKLTVQGGIGMNEEHKLLMEYHGVDATGWGSPFLLVPEAVNIDESHLKKLADADERDVYLSGASPLGVPFWNLRNSASEIRREDLIAQEKAGSPCPRGYLTFNTEFTEKPVCTASYYYQKKKLKEILNNDSLPEIRQEEILELQAKACLCRDLAGSALHNVGNPGKSKPIVCPGPNIINFNVVSTLKDMVDHIYGRFNLLKRGDRPHMFLKEMSLYLNRFSETLGKKKEKLDNLVESFKELEGKMVAGLNYYTEMASHMAADKKKDFLAGLDNIRAEINRVKEDLFARQALEMQPGLA